MLKCAHNMMFGIETLAFDAIEPAALESQRELVIYKIGWINLHLKVFITQVRAVEFQSFSFKFLNISLRLLVKQVLKLRSHWSKARQSVLVFCFIVFPETQCKVTGAAGAQNISWFLSLRCILDCQLVKITYKILFSRICWHCCALEREISWVFKLMHSHFLRKKGYTTLKEHLKTRSLWLIKTQCR